jgi:triosephosphate isomerase
MNLKINEIKEYEKRIRDYDVIVMPQIPYIGLFNKGKYKLGSQCISEYKATGGISSESLAGMNVKYVLVGHSERRKLLKETDEIIAKKINEIIINKMIPVFCIGESLNDKIHNRSLKVIEKQIDMVFTKVYVNKKRIIIAYEPVWAIGNNKRVNNKDIGDIIIYIKKYIQTKYQINLKVLYGGSVNYANIKSLIKIKGINGFIIGRASLDIDEVIAIYNEVNH